MIYDQTSAKLSGQVPPALNLALRKRLRGTWSAWSAVLSEYFIPQSYNYFFSLKNSLLSLRYGPFFDLFS